jgi:hypothetical protein
LIPEDVADAVIYAVSWSSVRLVFVIVLQVTRPAHCQVAEIMLYCTNQSGPRDIVRAGPSLGKTV